MIPDNYQDMKLAHDYFLEFERLASWMKEYQLHGLARNASRYGLGWKKSDTDALMQSFNEHVAKFREAVEKGFLESDARYAGADVMNLIAMICDYERKSG